MNAELSTNGVQADARVLSGVASPADADPAPAAPALPDEPEAWAAVLRGWEDDETHRAYLARFAELDGLAVAGGRYRDVLLRRPRDPVALRWRDEVVKRAMVQGLAQVPRARGAAGALRLRRALTIAVALAMGVLAWYAVRAMPALLGAAP